MLDIIEDTWNTFFSEDEVVCDLWENGMTVHDNIIEWIAQDLDAEPEPEDDLGWDRDDPSFESDDEEF